jgi:hypothetical protein
MHRLLQGPLIPIAIVVIGILSGVLPPSVPALWAVAVVSALLAVWFLVRAYGWRPAGTFAVVAVAISFGTETILVNPMGLLTHHSHPQLAGVAVLALIQDFVMVAASYILACALLPSGGLLTRAVGSGVLLLVATLISGPFASTLGYYTYNPPFAAWGESLGLEQVPSVPWAEPIGNSMIAVLTAFLFGAFGSFRRGERRFSPKWAALFFSTQALPGWAWAARTERWGLFAVGTVLLTGIVGLTVWRELTAATDDRSQVETGVRDYRAQPAPTADLPRE